MEGDVCDCEGLFPWLGGKSVRRKCKLAQMLFGWEYSWFGWCQYRGKGERAHTLTAGVCAVQRQHFLIPPHNLSLSPCASDIYTGETPFPHSVCVCVKPYYVYVEPPFHISTINQVLCRTSPNVSSHSMKLISLELI